jgi:hypothetical protein
LPVDERVTPLDQNAIPDDLTEATTTTTTTTTLPPTTSPRGHQRRQRRDDHDPAGHPDRDITVYYT